MTANEQFTTHEMNQMTTINLCILFDIEINMTKDRNDKILTVRCEREREREEEINGLAMQ